MRLTAADIAWFESWGASRYDPATGRLHIVGNPPPYVYAHERAHEHQHRSRTLLYRLWEFIESLRQRKAPIFFILHPSSFILRVLLELDADLRARAELREKGLWSDPENQKASHLVLRSYLCPSTLRSPN